MTEAEARGIAGLDELNDAFMAWAEQVANTRVHAETDQTPLARFAAGGAPRAVERSVMADAFTWSAIRKVTATATVSLAANRYTVDAALVGRRVELRYDPEDLTRLDVVIEGRPAGVATPFRARPPRAPRRAPSDPRPGAGHRHRLLGPDPSRARGGHLGTDRLS